jgi:hypothetical protein
MKEDLKSERGGGMNINRQLGEREREENLDAKEN